MKTIRIDRACANSLLGKEELWTIVGDMHQSFILVIDLLKASVTWDDHSDREFNKSLYSTALRCL